MPRLPLPGRIVHHVGTMWPLDRTFRLVAGGIAASCFLGTAILAAKVHHGRYPLRIDRRIDHIVHRSHFSLHFAARVFSLGTPLSVAVAIVVLAAFAATGRDWRMVCLAVVAPVATLLATEDLVKPLVDRRVVVTAEFPSGHVATVVALGVVATLVGYRRWGPPAIAVLAPCAGLAALVMSVAAIRSRAHVATDTVGGALFACGSVLVMAVVVTLAPVRRPTAEGSRPAGLGMHLA